MEVRKTKIKKLRLFINMSQKELAKKMGLSPSTVSMWEKGERSPRTDKLPDLARALGCTIDDLFREESKDSA